MTGWLGDPALQAALHLGFAALFLSSAWHKLADRRAFEASLAGYEILPAAWLRAAARGLMVAECLVGAVLLVPGLAPVAALLGAGLLGGYAVAMVIAWRRGLRDIDCGCSGSGARRPIGPDLVLRNVVLMVGLAVAAWPANDRPLLWLDAITVPAAVIAGALLYAAAERALGQARALADWRRSWRVPA